MTAAALNKSGPLPGRPMSVSDIYANARALSGYFKEQSAAIDEARRLPAGDAVGRLRGSGIPTRGIPVAPDMPGNS